MANYQLDNIQEALTKKLKPWERTMQFWARAVSVYTSYKVCQIRVKFVRGSEKQQRIWDEQHEIAADKIYSLCSDLGGFFLKAAQIIGKPDLAPNAWVKKLVTLCDAAPATPFEAMQLVLERELGTKSCEIFERFDRTPIGSASIAQVHRARMKGTTSDVAVKVQHPGIQELMMMDIRNLKNFAAYLQKTDVKFDLVSVLTEMEKQVDYEFDFLREAKSMDRIGEFLKTTNNGKPPVIVPRSIPGLITRGKERMETMSNIGALIRPIKKWRVLVMEFLEGTPILHLGDEMAKKGVSTDGRMAKITKRNILKNLTVAYGQMILKSGFFHADPHPGNILINKDVKVVLLDYGQVKELTQDLRLGYASLILALVSGDPLKIGQSFEELGIQTSKKAVDDPNAFKRLAQMMFDTKLPPGVKMATPFGEESTLQKIPVQSFPEDLFFVLRTIQLLRGLSVGMGINYSCAEEWRQIAEEALSTAGRFSQVSTSADSQRKNIQDIVSRKFFWRRKHRL